jgi:hypothetical protein
MRSEVVTAVKMSLMFFCVVPPSEFADSNVSEEHTASIFRAENLSLDSAHPAQSGLQCSIVFLYGQFQYSLPIYAYIGLSQIVCFVSIYRLSQAF